MLCAIFCREQMQHPRGFKSSPLDVEALRLCLCGALHDRFKATAIGSQAWAARVSEVDYRAPSCFLVITCVVP